MKIHFKNVIVMELLLKYQDNLVLVLVLEFKLKLSFIIFTFLVQFLHPKIQFSDKQVLPFKKKKNIQEILL